MTTPFHQVHPRDVLAELERRTRVSEQRAALLGPLLDDRSARSRWLTLAFGGRLAGEGRRRSGDRRLARLRRRRLVSVGAQLCLDPAR